MVDVSPRKLKTGVGMGITVAFQLCNRLAAKVGFGGSGWPHSHSWATETELTRTQIFQPNVRLSCLWVQEVSFLRCVRSEADAYSSTLRDARSHSWRCYSGCAAHSGNFLAELGQRTPQIPSSLGMEPPVPALFSGSQPSLTGAA